MLRGILFGLFLLSNIAQAISLGEIDTIDELVVVKISNQNPNKIPTGEYLFTKSCARGEDSVALSKSKVYATEFFANFIKTESQSSMFASSSDDNSKIIKTSQTKTKMVLPDIKIFKKTSNYDEVCVIYYMSLMPVAQLIPKPQTKTPDPLSDLDSLLSSSSAKSSSKTTATSEDGQPKYIKLVVIGQAENKFTTESSATPRQRAIKDALVNALTQALGTSVSSNSIDSSSESISGNQNTYKQIASHITSLDTKGKIANYKIISEFVDDFGIYNVKAEVSVSESALSETLTSVVATMYQPTVYIETNNAIAIDNLTKIAKGVGLEVITSKSAYADFKIKYTHSVSDKSKRTISMQVQLIETGSGKLVSTWNNQRNKYAFYDQNQSTINKIIKTHFIVAKNTDTLKNSLLAGFNSIASKGGIINNILVSSRLNISNTTDIKKITGQIDGLSIVDIGVEPYGTKFKIRYSGNPKQLATILGSALFVSSSIEPVLTKGTKGRYVEFSDKDSRIIQSPKRFNVFIHEQITVGSGLEGDLKNYPIISSAQVVNGDNYTQVTFSFYGRDDELQGILDAGIKANLEANINYTTTMIKKSNTMYHYSINNKEININPSTWESILDWFKILADYMMYWLGIGLNQAKVWFDVSWNWISSFVSNKEQIT